MAHVFILVDDDDDDRMLFCEATTAIGKGILPVATADGMQVINNLKQQSMPIPSVICLDINMPGKDGWYFLQLLKQDEGLKHIPVIMYSTSSHTNEITKAVKNGALFLFSKPDNFEDLKKCLEKIYTELEKGSLHTYYPENSKWFHS